MPIWIKLPRLRLHFWATKMLSKIASVVGKKSLYTDMVTTKTCLCKNLCGN